MAAVLVVVLVLVPLLVSSPFHFLLALSRLCFQHYYYYYYYFFVSKDVVLQCLPASLPDSGAHMSSGIAQEEEEEGYRWQMILGKQQKKKKKNSNVQDRKK